jgi:hypothetical protein
MARRWNVRSAAGHRFYLVLILALVVATVSAVVFARRSEADIVPGEYSLELSGSQASNAITLNVAIQHDGVNPGNYQAVQWSIDYDQTIVSFVSAAKTGPAPSDCGLASPNDDGDRLLVGCINFSGDNISFSGTAFTATFNCLHPGTADFVLANTSGASPDTFVSKLVGPQPIHTHDASIVCPEPPTDTPTFTSTFTPTHTPTVTNTPTITNTPTPTATGAATSTPTSTAAAGGNFIQVAYDPASQPTGAAFLTATDNDVETQLAGGLRVVTLHTSTLGPVRLVYGLQTGGLPVDLSVNGDVTHDGIVTFPDVLNVLARFGQDVPPWAGNHRFDVFNQGSYATLNDLLNAVDAQMETEITSGWDPKGSSLLTLDSSSKLVYSLERRARQNRPADGDMNLDGRITFVDVLAVLARFGLPK